MVRDLFDGLLSRWFRRDPFHAADRPLAPGRELPRDLRDPDLPARLDHAPSLAVRHAILGDLVVAVFSSFHVLHDHGSGDVAQGSQVAMDHRRAHRHGGPRVPPLPKLLHVLLRGLHDRREPFLVVAFPGVEEGRVSQLPRPSRGLSPRRRHRADRRRPGGRRRLAEPRFFDRPRVAAALRADPRRQKRYRAAYGQPTRAHGSASSAHLEVAAQHRGQRRDGRRGRRWTPGSFLYLLVEGRCRSLRALPQSRGLSLRTRRDSRDRGDLPDSREDGIPILRAFPGSRRRPKAGASDRHGIRIFATFP